MFQVKFLEMFCLTGLATWHFTKPYWKFFPSLAFTLSTDTKSHRPVVVVSQRALAYHPPFGLVSRVVITIQGCKYTAHILMRMWKSGELDGRDSIHLLCSKFIANTEYKFGPGIDPEDMSVCI